MEKLRLVLCPTKNVRKEDQETLNKVYKFWQGCWRSAYEALGHDPMNVTSDAFTRADYAGSFFYKGSCVATVLIRWVDPKEVPLPEDSYFIRAWRKHFDQVRSHKKVMICSHMCFDPNAKNIKTNPLLRDAMVYAHMKVFLASGADRLLATPRVDRKVDELLYAWNAQPVEREVESGYGDTMALTYFRPEDALASSTNRNTPELQSVWDEREVLFAKHENFEFLTTNDDVPTTFKKAG